MIKEKLGIDDKDIQILAWFIKDPYISQNEIAKRLKLSQPSVNVRVQRLRKKGILNANVGINLNKTNLLLARVDFTSNDVNKVFKKLKDCPFFVNGFVMSGKHNVSIFLVHENLRKIDEIVNETLRKDEDISDIHVHVVVDSVRDFLFKLDLHKELSPGSCYDFDSCKECEKSGKKEVIPF